LETISAPSLAPAAKEDTKAADSTAPEKACWRRKKKAIQCFCIEKG
jgi:hypothetical protein